MDYPATLMEFEQRFASEEACRSYLAALRWPDGFQCPYCRSQRAGPTGRDGLMQCVGCRRQTSVTVGTIFEGTRTPLRIWFRAMWWVTNQKHGMSALGLQRALGLGSYQTAWGWLHKLRRAMVRPGRDRLSGRVEVDETYVGGVEKGAHGRATESKAIVAIAVEEDGEGMGRIRLRRIADVSAKSLLGFVGETITPGSVVHTDGWRGYAGLPAVGYKHEATNIKRSEELAHELLPRVHRIAALLKRWLLGTHQNYVSLKHLDHYLDEYTFRFNRRTSGQRGQLFLRLAEQAVTIGPVPYRTLVGGKKLAKQPATGAS